MTLGTIWYRLRRGEDRPAWVIAAGVLAYLVFVSCPKVFRLLRRLWDEVRAFGHEYNAFSTCLIGFGYSALELLCLLAGLAIWVLSILVSWSAFRKSRHKAYLFLLAYLLMPLAIYPTSRLISEITARRQEIYTRNLPSDLKYEQAQPVAVVAEAESRDISIPIGPLLLLASIWYLYKKEQGVADKPTVAS